MQATVTPVSRLHFYDMTCEMSVFTLKNTSFPQCTQSVSSRGKDDKEPFENPNIF